jgi:tetratricopeptide (TPR) repeat protein
MKAKISLLLACLIFSLVFVNFGFEVRASEGEPRDFKSIARMFEQTLPQQPTEQQMTLWTENLLQMYFWTKDNFSIQQEEPLTKKILFFSDYLIRLEALSDKKKKFSASGLKALKAAFLLFLHEYEPALQLAKNDSHKYLRLVHLLVGEPRPDNPQIWRIPLREARQLLKDYPSALSSMAFVESVLEEGDSEQSKQLLNDAELVLAKALSLNKQNLYLQYQKAQILYFQGKQALAFQSFDALLKHSSKSYILAESIGNFYSWSKLYSRSADALERARQLQPRQLRLYRKLEQVYMQLEDPIQAIKLYLSGLQLKPQESSFYEALSVLAEQAELQKIVLLLPDYLKQTPNNAYIHIFNGDIAYRSGDLAAAQAAFEKAIQLEPNLGQAYGNLFYLFWKTKNWKELESSIQQARQNAIITPMTFYWAGLLHLQLNQPQQAIAELEKVTRKDNAVKHALFMAYRQNKQFVKAREFLQEMLKEEPKDIGLLLNMGDIYIDEKKADKAEDYYRWAQKIEPYNPEVYFSLGNLYADTGRSDMAQAAFERSIMIQPDDLEARNNLGNVLLKQKSYFEAVQQFQRILRLNPDYATAYYNIACVYSLNHQKEAALMYLKQALERDQSLKTLAGHDPDLDNLRQDNKFQELVR